VRIRVLGGRRIDPGRCAILLVIFCMDHGWVQTRFSEALDALVAQIKGDRSILAAILCGSLSHQIGSGLMGMLYVLDEPSIGLHPKDNAKMIATMRRLRDIGNTVIVVEHDEETIRAADHLVEMGPGPGVHGGTVVVQGTLADLLACGASPTGRFLSGSRSIATPERRRKGNGKTLTVRGARPVHTHTDSTGTRLQTRALQLQCQRRPVRRVPGRGGHHHSALLHARRRGDLWCLQRGPIQQRDARGHPA
jgi:hypothetical protein